MPKAPQPKTQALQFFESHFKQKKSKEASALIKKLKSDSPGRNPRKSAELYGQMARFERNLHNPLILEHQLSQILSLAKFQPSDNVVSIGSGVGATETFIAKNTLHNGKMTCVDFAHGMNEEANKIKTKEKVTNMPIITASGTNLPLRPGTQDFVLVIQSNMPNTKVWSKVLGEARRVLKPTPRARLIFTILPKQKNAPQEISRVYADLQKHGFKVETLLHYLNINEYYGAIIVAKPLTIFG